MKVCLSESGLNFIREEQREWLSLLQKKENKNIENQQEKISNLVKNAKKPESNQVSSMIIESNNSL